MTIELKPHQKEIVDMNPERALVSDMVGSGKTIIGIFLANKNCKTCLVVTLKDNVAKWERDVQSFSEGKCKFVIMSKENFKKNSLTLEPTSGIIVDEAHTFAGAKSQLSKALASYLKKHNIKYRYLMSGTPVTSNWLSVYVLANHLGHNLNYYKFLRMFFYEVKIGRRSVWKPNPHKEAQLQDLVRKLSMGRMVRMEDIAEVPEQKFVTEYFNTTEEQNEAIKNLEDFEHIVRFTKIHQIEQGTLAGSEYEAPQSFQCLKNFRIWELAKDNSKVAVFCRYNHQISVLKDYLKDLGKPIFIINGESKNRDATVQAAEKAPEAIVLVNSAVGTGWEMPSVGVIVFASLSFSFIDHEQSKGRFLRINRLKPNVFYYLVTKGSEGSVDSDVYDCIMSKQNFYIELYKKNETNTR